MNVTLGSGKAVHAGDIVPGYVTTPMCGGNRAAERFVETNKDVTCKRCIKIMASQAEQRDRLEYATRAAEKQDAVMSQAEPTPALSKPVTHRAAGEHSEAITPDMAGTWLDGHHGWHNSYRVVDLAVGYGFTVPEEYRAALTEFRDNGHGAHEDAWEAVCGQGELSDMATDHLNNLAPDGYVFVWDMGEFSLMTDWDAEML